MYLTVDASILDALQAIAGERQQRDSSNNPQIPDDKVPKGSAASKTCVPVLPSARAIAHGRKLSPLMS